LHVFAATWLAVVLAAIAAPSPPQSSMADLRARFEHEPNPVQKAKLMQSLGDAEFVELRKHVENGEFPDALNLYRKYRDETQACIKALDGAKLDAEKHPNGFKQLEFSLQDSLRRLDMLLPGMTQDDQAPFLDVRKDIEEMHRHVIEELFPDKASPGPKAEKPKAE